MIGTALAWWQVAAVAGLVIAIAYLAIAMSILRGVVPGGEWRRNPLATATAAIFVTCAVHHGTHGVHLLITDDHPGHASMRAAFDNWFIGGWDVVATLAALWYWRLRRLFPALVRGAALFDDLEERRRHALRLHDDVVQGLATAKLQLELGRRDDALDSMRSTLETAKGMITDLLIDGEGRVNPSIAPQEAGRATS